MTREMASPVSRWASPEPGLSLTGKPDHLLCSLPGAPPFVFTAKLPEQSRS